MLNLPQPVLMLLLGMLAGALIFAAGISYGYKMRGWRR